jgi:OmpA-OmpF porin, OOP family
MVVGVCGTARGQEGFALGRFNPSSAGSDWFALDSLDLRFHLRPAYRIGMDLAHRPLVLRDGDGQATVVSRQVSVHLGVAMNFAERVRVGFKMPFVAEQAGEDRQIDGNIYRAPTDGNIGDVSAAADVRLIGEYGEPFTLAVGTEIFFPTGSQAHYTGDGRPRVLPRLLGAGEAGIWAYAGSLGVHVRRPADASRFEGAGFGPELAFGGAVGLRPTPAVLVGAELFGASVLGGGRFLKERATPVEALLGVQLAFGERFGDRWRLAAGIGAGLSDGLGAPSVRALVRFEYFPTIAPDRDNDGVIDAEDACPEVPGVPTNDPSTNGCPPPRDRDHDGILDPEDACPDRPGVRTNDPKTSGCPPPQDRDHDGILDPEDACPDVPGIRTPDPRTNGCPADRDKDGILDGDDACPDIPGEKTDNPRTNGCPDTDKDGIHDPEDACPKEPGPRDPDPTKNGCPVAKVEKGEIRILEQVKFRTGSDVILPASDYILEAVAKVLADHPEIKRLRVEGHTDSRGGRAYNLGLSLRRAQSVVRWLTTRGGIVPSRLISQGFGFDRPLADNATEQGRYENRRVVFRIVDPPAAP